MSLIVKNSLRLVGAIKNITSNTTTFQRSMWHMTSRSYGSTNNSIELIKAHNFNIYLCKRLQHILDDSSKEACKVKLPVYKLKNDDETYENVAQEKTQLQNNQIFVSVDNNGEIIFKTIDGYKIYAADSNELHFPITEEIFKKLKKDMKTPEEKRNELIRNFRGLISSLIWCYIMGNLSCFSEHVYEENGLRPVLDYFSYVI